MADLKTLTSIILILLGIHFGATNASRGLIRQRISEGYLNLRNDAEGFIRIAVSEKGLNYVRDILVEQALQSLVPLHVPDITKSLYFPFIVDFNAELYNSSITNVSVPSSSINLGKAGINIIASQMEVNLSMQWKYSYKTWLGWLVPLAVSDKGLAFVTVEGMEVGITFELDEETGSLHLIALECGTFLKDITINLEGGASWLYQGFVDAFEGEIRDAIENAVTSKIKEGIIKLNSLLQNLPKEIEIDRIAALNFTIVQAPDVGPTYISIGVEGLFLGMTPDNARFHPVYDLQPRISCSGPSKMLEIAISEAVLNSASEVYTNAGALQWLVDKLPEQALLNTASWRFIVPQLFTKYPNHDMKLNISVSSPPILTFTSDGVEGIVVADMTVDVMDRDDTIPVACMSMTISASGLMGISGNNITGTADLQDLDLELKWSIVGNFHMRLIQVIVRPVVKDVVLPVVNAYLKRGFPLPIIKNFTVQNADIIYGESQLVVCTDVQYMI